jgi:radical SAM superfamily enzyme YgiQ (UPF0313 family)
MKILLTAINAKYIHSNPAVYSLRVYAGEIPGREIEIAEYTINHQAREILADIYRRQPDMLLFSCYIWNWRLVERLLPEIPKILPEAEIWLGGPEVSYNAEEILLRFPMLRGIMTGEGEQTFKELAEGKKPLAEVRGLVYRQRDKRTAIPDDDHQTQSADRREQGSQTENDTIVRTEVREPADLSTLPFLYEHPEQFENRIIYYESSRGCPYRCSYCLSSIEKKVRLRPLALVTRELQVLLDHQVKQVKFVDRTFNCDHEHTMGIWRYLLEHDNGVTNFHFEIEADILTEEELELLAQMRPGLVQMEIGVQTTNPVTLKEIRRSTDFERLKNVVERIEKGHNIHVHLDLIAGLPYEDYDSFRQSFNEVYGLKPEQLQLGFLKVLKGAHMHEMTTEYELKYTDEPPYEVLSTKWLPYGKVLLLKEVEEMVETYYNSNQFVHTIHLLEQVFPDAFGLYLSLAEYYREKGLFVEMPARSERYQVLFDFAMTTSLCRKEMLFREALSYDLYLRENVKNRPDFLPRRDEETEKICKEKARAFYEREEKERTCLTGYEGYDSRQMSKMTHMGWYAYPVWRADLTLDTEAERELTAVLFDYRQRDALTYEARTVIL